MELNVDLGAFNGHIIHIQEVLTALRGANRRSLKLDHIRSLHHDILPDGLDAGLFGEHLRLVSCLDRGFSNCHVIDGNLADLYLYAWTIRFVFEVDLHA